ncbi:MAG: hypothetical protein FWD98_07190 [Defluviitaleaceae bacterium]|nr:hypothetical protein [Defluviitaleaceae bacterium]
MSEHINRVFVDGIYRYSGLAKKDLAATKKDFRQNAMKVLKDTGVAHVVYCHIEYNEDGEITCASFYSNLPMDEATFDERTRTIPGTDFIGAIHNHA